MPNSVITLRPLAARLLMIAALTSLPALFACGCGSVIETGGKGSTGGGGAGGGGASTTVSSTAAGSGDTEPHEECFTSAAGTACPPKDDAMNRLHHTCDAQVVSEGTFNDQKQSCCYQVFTLPGGCGGS